MQKIICNIKILLIYEYNYAGQGKQQSQPDTDVDRKMTTVERTNKIAIDEGENYVSTYTCIHKKPSS